MIFAGSKQLWSFWFWLQAGDISASTSGERVCDASNLQLTNFPLTFWVQIFCIFLFLCAASLFGTLVSQANEIVAAQQVKSKELDGILEAYESINPRYPSSIYFFLLILTDTNAWLSLAVFPSALLDTHANHTLPNFFQFDWLHDNLKLSRLKWKNVFISTELIITTAYLPECSDSCKVILLWV